MARLTARIIRLERRLSTGHEAEELERRIDESLRAMAEDELTELTLEYPAIFAPEVLERGRVVARKQQGE